MQKTAYEMRISDWSSDVCSSDLEAQQLVRALDEFAGQHLADAQVEPGEVLDRDRRRSSGVSRDRGGRGLCGWHRSCSSRSSRGGGREGVLAIGRASGRERVGQYVYL